MIRPGQPLAQRHAKPEETLEDAGRHAHDEGLVVRVEEVDVAVRGAQQRGGPADDRFEEVLRVVVVQQGQGRLVERLQVGVGGNPWRRPGGPSA